MGEIEFGKCDVCGKEAQLNRKYYRYNIKCECHSPQHFEIVWHCKDCEPKEPRETKITFSTFDLKHNMIINTDWFEHLLNSMCNQKYIHEQKPKTQMEWKKVIDKAWHQGMELLISFRKEV